MAHHIGKQYNQVMLDELTTILESKYDPEPVTNSVSLNAGADEMLRIAQDGFYVRGVRVPVDDKEAEVVYNAFKQWLAWAQLSAK